MKHAQHLPASPETESHRSGRRVAAAPRREPAPSAPRSAIARNIQMARTIFNLSQEALGARCELHRTHISALEREGLNAGIDTIDRVAQAFGVPAYVLMMPPPEAQGALYRSYSERVEHFAA
jgi:DNA-binding XRE family transcriptional regulator